MKFRRLRLLRHSLYLCYLLAAQACAAESAADVKAAFIYNFAKFVEWPSTAFADASAPMVLCYAGAHPLDDKLRLLDGREAQGHRLQVIDLGSRDPATCHLLFVPATEFANSQRALAAIAAAPVLTISDADSFEQQGGMIGLFIDAERLKFSVDPGAMQAAGLKMGARILQLASHVRRRP